MKKRNLGQVLTILFISGIMTTAGTLAWFQSVRNAQISFESASVYSGSSDLLVNFKSSLNTITSDKDTSNNSISLSGDLKVTDISGDGINLYKPVWSATDEVAQKIKPVPTTGAAGVADDYYIDFTITVGREASVGEGVKVFLGAGSGIFPKNPLVTKDVGIVKATRLAVINYVLDEETEALVPELVFRHAPYAETNPTYLIPGTGAYGSTTNSLATDSDLKSNAFITGQTIAASEAAYPAIANLMTESSQDVTFRVWVEGTDVDAENDNISGIFSIVLNLYAVAE